jgi:hypothetical protein
MIFKLIKWSAMIKLAMIAKPYAATALTATGVFLLVVLMHQELLSFLKDTNQAGMIAYAYFTKWTLLVCMALITFYKIKQIGKRLKLQADKPPVAAPVSSKHQHLLTKGKLMSKGDKILKQ